MQVTTFDRLKEANLFIDATYQGRRNGNAGDDPLPALLGISNQGGFRILGSQGRPRLVVLTTSMDDPEWPDSLKNQLNPDVTVRSRGIMEKCSFCVQRIRGATRKAKQEGRDVEDGDRGLNPACVNSCPTDTLVFGDISDVMEAAHAGQPMPAEPKSRAGQKIAKEMQDSGRGYSLFEDLGTRPNVVYLKKVDKEAKGSNGHA